MITESEILDRLNDMFYEEDEEVDNKEVLEMITNIIADLEVQADDLEDEIANDKLEQSVYGE